MGGKRSLTREKSCVVATVTTLQTKLILNEINFSFCFYS